MPELHDLLERRASSYEPAHDLFERVVSRRDRRQRNQRIAAGILGIAVFALAAVGLIRLLGSNEPKPAEPTPLPSTPRAWSRVGLDPPVVGGADPSFLAADPDRLVVVGVSEGPATAWTSSDGATWARTPSEDLDGTDLYDMRSQGERFIAGHDDAFLTSEDGVSWRQLSAGDPAFQDTLFISAVAPGGPGLVAVGSHMGAWYSSDGSTWERASVPPVPPEIYPGDDGHTPQIYLTNVADRGDRLVATGWGQLTTDGNGNHPVLVIWTSRDGRSWTDVPTPEDVFPPDSDISDITAGPDGFVAVGQINAEKDSTPAIWTSPDGRDWRLHRVGPDGLQLSSVAAGDAGYVAVGADMACDTSCPTREAVVMTSRDGDTWVTVPNGPGFRVDGYVDPQRAQGAAMFQVVAWGSRFAALGTYDGQPTVWMTHGVQGDVTTPPVHEPVHPGSNALAYGVDGDVFLADADGTNAVKIADGEPYTSSGCAPGEVRVTYYVNGTAWSPDGRYLAYWNSRPCPAPSNEWGSVIISDAKGNVVTSFPGEGWAIAWSPDSTRVAVMDNWSPKGQELVTVGVYGLDGTRQAALTVPRGMTPTGDYSPVWSRDGSSILLPGVRLPLDGGDPTPSDEGGFFTGCCTYSPDGSRRAVVDRGSLVVEDAAAPDAEKIGGALEFWQAAWSPNGDLVAYEGDGGTLVVRDVVTGNDTVLVDVKRLENLHVIEFSPDGDRIIFTRYPDGGDPESLWSIRVDGSGVRRLVDRVDWADLRPQGRGEEA